MSVCPGEFIRKTKSKTLRIVLLVAGVILALLIARLATMDIGPSISPEKACLFRLLAIKDAVGKYEYLYDKYPDSLIEILEFLPNPNWLICPVRRKGVFKKTDKLSDNDIDYIIVRAAAGRNSQLFPLIADKKGNHKNVRNVLFANGQHKWVTEENFQNLLKGIGEDKSQ